MEVKQATGKKEVEAMIDLRYKILRRPWDQPKETATDGLEETSINLFITDETGTALACGRLQENENKVGQIRYMAVDDSQQGKGLGKKIVQALEKKGKELGLTKIELQARENAVEFYKSNGYTIKEKSFLLWDLIQHYLMEKEL
ncbi:MAG: GNAT family N-acetyltransferase [Bacteroidetes bacterium]|nr:GNAT family N-acetyltransferase [Bacteroidota bacterium]